MASDSKRSTSRSFVADLIKFDASDNPPWHNEADNPPVPCVLEMVKEIVQFQQEWTANKDKENNDSSSVRYVCLVSIAFYHKIQILMSRPNVRLFVDKFGLKKTNLLERDLNLRLRIAVSALYQLS